MKEKSKLRRNKYLRNKKSFLFLLILCLGIGFAFLSTQLTITGNTSVSGNKWSVYFNNVQITEGSVDASVVPTTTGTTTTSLEYTVSLDKPGDFYEFTVDAVNDGTIDAMIESITMTTVDTDVAKYLNYIATYDDGTALVQNDLLEAKDIATYKIRVEYKKDILASDLNENSINLNLSFGVDYVQSTIKTVPSKFAKLIKSSAVSDNGINFKSKSSSANGTGLYLLSGTEDDDYPIYYYRGAVENNNAKFAGFCWKVVRTTETGGTKLIYNGTPDENGNCSNTTGASTQLSQSNFNLSDSIRYVGYMYGTAYERGVIQTNSSYLYGNSFTYADGVYTLKDTRSGLDSSHRYTCYDTTGQCEKVYFVHNLDRTTPKTYSLALTGGKSIEDALSDNYANKTNSPVKSVLDNWFKNTFKSYFTQQDKDYNDYLEDTIWCNDRSSVDIANSGFNPDGGSLIDVLTYSSATRISSGKPSVSCPNKNDSFTVVETETGNGALTYPIGTLTADEVILAGGQDSENDSYYLYTNYTWWTMSPYSYVGTVNNSRNFIVNSNGSLGNIYTGYSWGGVRPSISLKPNVKIVKGGDGSSATPYEFVVE